MGQKSQRDNRTRQWIIGKYWYYKGIQLVYLRCDVKMATKDWQRSWTEAYKGKQKQILAAEEEIYKKRITKEQSNVMFKKR